MKADRIFENTTVFYIAVHQRDSSAKTIGRRSDRPVGVINVNIDKDLHHTIKLAALEERVTLTEYVTRLIEDAVDGRGGPEHKDGVPRLVGPSGSRRSRLSMHIDPGLHRELKRASQAAGVTVTAYLTRLVEDAVSAAQVAREGER